jgi:superfamily I DNA/RNA helicase
LPELIARIEKYFDLVCIDEVQDFSGSDFNLLCGLAKANVQQLLVGDFFQHTFETSRDGNINASLHDDYQKYQSRFISAGFVIDTDLLSKSYRCSPSICKFVSGQLGVEIQSHREDETEVILIECSELARQLFMCRETVKLFYRGSDRYAGLTENWGATKGQDCYHDVCVVLNQNTFSMFKNSALHKLAPQTKNKLYVACTRAKRNLYFVPESMLQDYRR